MVTNQIFRCPGKVFILGEYACLLGHPAILLPCGPDFELRVSNAKDTGNALSVFAAASPAGQLLTAHGAQAQHLNFEWKDPHPTPIGVGSSSAQFILSARALAAADVAPFSNLKAGSLEECQQLLWTYWKMVGDSQGLRPSGIDIVLQAFGRASLIANEPLTVKTIKPTPFHSRFEFVLAFSGQKNQTHSHLRSLKDSNFLAQSEELKRLAHLVEQGLALWESGDAASFGQILNRYQQTLASMNLVPTEFGRKIAAIQCLNGVLGAKGAGAQGGDCVLLLIEKSKRNEIGRALNPLGFELVEFVKL